MDALPFDMWVCVAARTGADAYALAQVSRGMRAVVAEGAVLAACYAAVINDLGSASGAIHRNIKNVYKRTALHCAAVRGRANVARALIGAGSSTSERDSCGTTPLNLAARKGHADVVRVLLASGASHDEVNSCKTTPLHCAALSGNGEVVRVLLDAGASHCAVDERGWTPLHLAASESVARVLMDAGASACATDAHGITPLHCAAAWGHTSVVRILLTATPRVAETDAAIMNLAIKRGYASHDTVRILIDAGASHSVADAHGMTPLHCAAKYARGDIARILLDAGASRSAVDLNELGATFGADAGGTTASMLAARAGHAHLALMCAPPKANVIRSMVIKGLRGLFFAGTG
jgi:ankyrin repeat protein